jgi:hypothetical protein
MKKVGVSLANACEGSGSNFSAIRGGKIVVVSMDSIHSVQLSGIELTDPRLIWSANSACLKGIELQFSWFNGLAS